jgi:N-acyl-D-amino-acid deacylase
MLTGTIRGSGQVGTKKVSCRIDIHQHEIGYQDVRRAAMRKLTYAFLLLTVTVCEAWGQSPPVVTGAVTAASGACPSLPSTKSTFQLTDSLVWFDFTYTGGSAGDSWSVEWFEPNGAPYAINTFTQKATGGSSCYEYTIGISGYMPASVPGQWRVESIWEGQVVASSQFTLASASPLITALNPSVAVPGGPAFKLGVFGGGFASSSVVQWNGSSLQTVFVGANQLTASVPASLIAASGTANVTVLQNGAASGSVSFIVPVVAPTGLAVPSLSSFDSLMESLLAKYNIPGGSIALTQNGRLVFARGYGYANPQEALPAQPDSRYRVASLSKAITATTIMHLVEQGKLSLDQPAFALLPSSLQPPAGSTPDSRIASITVRNLLNHAGGWDDSPTGSNFDPMFNSPTICAKLGAPAPASTENIIRYMWGYQPLQFNPGTQYAYSNFGYAVLGRIIENLTGMSYEQYVRENVLAPMGIGELRIGQTLPEGQLPNEVVYKSPGNGPSVFPDVASPVPLPYGDWYIESMDSHGGWVATAIDYIKFLNAIEGRRGTPFLSAASIAQMTALPTAVTTWDGSSSWYGFGLLVNTANNWWHSGSLDGTATYQIRTATGFNWVVFLNYRGDNTGAQTNLFSDIDSGLWAAANAATAWPTNDLFTNYPDSVVGATQTQPALTTREGVVNGATFDRGIVSGSWITLFGDNLSGTTRTWTSADIVNGNLPTSLDNVGVTINGQPAYVYYISPTQINVQAPKGLPSAWVAASVTYNGFTTSPILTEAAPNAPGALTYAANGKLYAVATNAAGTQIIGSVAGTTPAVPGSLVTIYATGLAASQAGVASPALTDVTATTLVTIGGQSAKVTYSAAGTPGLFQINAVVPSNLQNGDQQLVIAIAGKQSPANVYLSIHQ